MPKTTLTDRYIRAVKPAPAGKRVIHWDAAQRSLGLRVTDKGAKSFVVVRRLGDGGRLIFHRLGAYPEMSLANARSATQDALRQLVDGKTPAEAKADLARAEEALRLAEEERKAGTFGAIAESFIEAHLPRLKSRKAAEAEVRRLIDAWGGRQVAEIDHRDVITITREAAKVRGAYAARHVIAQASRIFNWALTNNLGEMMYNPCARVKISDLLGERTARGHVLSDRDCATVWQAACVMSYPWGPMYRLLLLTGARLREISDARWREIHGDILVVPVERMKTKVTHTIPLTRSAMAIVESLPRFGMGDHVFTTSLGLTSVSGFTRAKEQLDRAVAKIGPVERFIVHDLRRTVRTGISTTGVMPFIAELVIGHAQRGVHAVYDRHTYDAEKRAALEAWERKLLGIAGVKQ